jgi:NADPH-dependent glutamate synthase beta subunit-like oxidoreductase
VGKKVAVVGGGNVAVDAARSALRAGAKEVVIVYRRSRDEMPAYPEEVAAAEGEGIKIQFLALPTKVIGKDGKVSGLECIKTQLGEPDASGRRKPEPVKGSEFVIDVDTVIAAVGEAPDLAFLDAAKFALNGNKTLKAASPAFVTNVKGVFAGGDAVTGPATVIEAIAAGKKAALAIDKYLRGESLDYQEPVPSIIGIEDVDLERFKKRERQEMPLSPAAERAKSFGEVELGFSERTALFEADRCFQCGLFPNKNR